MRIANSLENTLMLGKFEGRRTGQQRTKWLDDITDSADMSLNKLGDSEGRGNLDCCSPWSHKESNITERLNNKYQAVEQMVRVFHILLRKEIWQESREDPAVENADRVL